MRASPLVLALLVASIATGGVARAGDERVTMVATPTPPSPATNTFIQSYLAPRMSARLGDTRAAVNHEFANPAFNPWTRSTDETEDRVRRGAIKGAKSAIKRYALERLNLTGWSLPLTSTGRGNGGASAFRTDSGGTRLRFGFSHRAPTAEVIVPLDRGRLAFSATGRGRVGTSFEMPNGQLRFSAYFDPQEDMASAGLGIVF